MNIDSKGFIVPNIQQPPAQVQAEEEHPENLSVVSQGTNPSFSSGKPFQASRMERIQRLKRSSQPNVQPFHQIEGVLNVQQDLRQTHIPLRISDESQDTLSSYHFTSTKIRKLQSDREKEQGVLFNQLEDDSLQHLYEQLKVAQRQKEEFDRKQQEHRQDKFVEDTTEQVRFLENELEKVVNQLQNVTQFVFEKVKNMQNTTKDIFVWYSHSTQNDIAKLASYQENTNSKILAVIKDLQSTDEAVDALLSRVEELNSTILGQNSQVTTVIQEIFSFAKSHVESLQRQVNANKELVVQNHQGISKQYSNDLNDMKLQNQSLVALARNQQQRLDVLEKTLSDFTKKTDVAYFTSNMLIDNDKFLKDGIQETTSKQANLLDLFQIFVNQITTDQNQPQVSKAAAQFQDSVRSLNLNRKVKKDFPDIQKIPEFLQYDSAEKDERMETDSKVHDKFYPEYQRNVQRYFDNYPKVSQLFMVNSNKEQEGQSQPQGENPSNPSNPLADILSQLKSNKAPEYQEPTHIKLLQRDRENSQPNVDNPRSQQKAFPYEDILQSLGQPNPTYGIGNVRYAPVERHYHKFQFKEKFTRNTHPKIFMLQFETLANQCGLTDEEKSMQFMFTLQGEFLDWYKARYINTTKQLTWKQLSTSFLQTYTKTENEAEEDLYRITQRQNETAQAFLQRLRDAVNTSDLSDDHIKKQFCTGLQNQKAKSYIYNMKQFNPNLYARHTTTTLLLELEKQSKIFNFDLVTKSQDKSQQQRKTNSSNSYYRNKSRSSKQYTPKHNTSNEQKQAVDTTKVTPVSSKPYYKSKDYNNRNSSRKINFVDQPSQESNDDSSLHSSHSSQKVEDFEAECDESTSSQSQTEQQEMSQLVLAGPSIPINSAQINSVDSMSQIKTPEGEQVHSLFRNSQKNAQNLNEKLTELVSKGKKLQRIDYKSLRSAMYLHLPDEQVLIESPRQFLSATNYLFGCLLNDDNLLKTDQTLKGYRIFVESLNNRLKQINPNQGISSTKAQDGSEINTLTIENSNAQDQANLAIPVKSIDYLYYIRIKFEGKSITALVDTGSTVTVISQHYCNRNNIQIPKCETMREVTLADGSTTKMVEWKNAKITLDEYNSITCDVLISKSKAYDMLFGLNACLSIGASLYPEFLRYYVKINDKERFGKLPIEKQNRKSI